MLLEQERAADETREFLSQIYASFSASKVTRFPRFRPSWSKIKKFRCQTYRCSTHFLCPYPLIPDKSFLFVAMNLHSGMRE